ncbi:hypothetical protein IWW50_003211, partial [Coemansia erecta]
TSSAKRRTRSRIDIRDVFAGSVRAAGVGRQLSPLVSQFGSTGRKSLRLARRSSQFGGNTLSMAMAQMAMIPPKSPYLTNVNSVPDVPPVPPMAKRQQSAASLGVSSLAPESSVRAKQSNMSLRSQRSHDAALKQKASMQDTAKAPVQSHSGKKKEELQGTLERSNSAAAKTAAAVKRLQAISGSPPKVQESPKTTQQEPPKAQERPAQLTTQLATPPSSANQPEEVVSPQRPTRLTPAPVPTLRDMLLSHRYSPQKPTAPAQPTRSLSSTSQPFSNIDAALGSLSLEAKQQQQQMYRAQASAQSSLQSSPERVLAHPRSLSVSSSSEGEHEMTRSEEDVREGLQRVKIAMGRPNGGSLSVHVEAAENERIREARERIEGIERALSPDASDADLEALCRDIDEVANMLPSSCDESQNSDAGEHHAGAGQRRFVDVEIDQQPIEVQLDGSETESVEGTGKRKHSDEDTPTMAPSRLLAPTASSLARGRGRGKPRGALHATSGIPRQPGSRGVVPPPRSDSRMGGVRKLANPPRSRIAGAPSSAGIRVAEARRKFESPVPPSAVVAPKQFVSPVAAMRPGYSSIVQTPAAMAAHGAQAKRTQPQGPRTAPKTSQKSSTAAMREAARKAATVRKPAPTKQMQPKQMQAQPKQMPPQQRTGNEPLFKSVAPRNSQSSLRSQPSREQLKQPRHNAESAIPIPASAQKSEAVDDPSGSADSGRWGLSSVLSMLSPSSWKAQGDELKEPETPTAPHLRGAVGSPYDLHSPQTPYEPRPEHGGGQGQLVMPAYQDVTMPLRRSSGRPSSTTSSHASRRESGESVRNQRLIQVKEGGRVSGMSAISSSFFSDDDSSTGGTLRKRSFGMTRTQSTPDLPQQLRSEREMSTPAPGLRRKASSIRSTEYTSIIPNGSNSPPEIESDYSDEYSDEEFTPTVKRKKNDFKIPKWATTPELLRGLEDQSRLNPDRIFGKVKPIRVNEIFNRKEDADARRRPRNSSMIWDGKDALTPEDELEYIRSMGFDP